MRRSNTEPRAPARVLAAAEGDVRLAPARSAVRGRNMRIMLSSGKGKLGRPGGDIASLNAVTGESKDVGENRNLTGIKRRVNRY